MSNIKKITQTLSKNNHTKHTVFSTTVNSYVKNVLIPEMEKKEMKIKQNKQM